jgi:hypothetical protein
MEDKNMELGADELKFSGIDLNKQSLKILENNLDVKNLELKQFALDSDWSVLSKLKYLKSLTIRDSYIDFKKFYIAICSLPNLEFLTYNHYCFFNKDKSDRLPTNLKLPSLKKFKIEFPDETEPNFEINTWPFKSHEEKNNSITELKNCHKIFSNLEEIQFVNYQTYSKLIYEECTDKRKLKSSIYWNVDLKTLNRFNSLKKITINDGKPSSFLELGLNELFKNNFQKANFAINGVKEKIKNFPQDYSVLNFTYENTNVDNNLTFKRINSEIQTKMENIFKDSKSLSINLRNFYDAYGSKKFLFKKNENNKNILKNKFDTVVFSPGFDFMHRNNNYLPAGKKIKFFLNIFNEQKNLKNMVFDFSKGDHYKDDEYESDQFIFLTTFIYELFKLKPNIKIYFFYKELKDILENRKVKNNKFKNHLIYILNFIFQHKTLFKDQIQFIDSTLEELQTFYEKFVIEEIDQVMEVDDVVFNFSKRFPDKDVIYAKEFNDLSKHYPFFYFDDDKTKFSLKRTYSALLSISSFDSDEFEINENDLLLLVKKNKLQGNILKKGIKKYFSYLGSPSHHLGMKIEEHEKDFKLNKIYDGSEIDTKKRSEVIEKAIDLFINSNEFKETESLKKQFLISPDQINYITENLLLKDKGKNLTHCWLEGVRPNLQQYVIFKELVNLIPTENLEHLRLSDCIARNDLSIPYLPKLKTLRLDFAINHHQKTFRSDSGEDGRYDGSENENLKYQLNGFKNLPNLEKLEINHLFSSYNTNFSRDLCVYRFGTDRWANINVNFENIEKLTKLKKVRIIDAFKASNLRTINHLPALEELFINELFHITEEMNPDDKKHLQQSIADKDLKFLSGSKKIKELLLRFGNIWNKEENYGRSFDSHYRGNGEFINYISHNIKKLNISINLDINHQDQVQDIINKICNRFLKLETLELDFGFVVSEKTFDFDKNEYKKKIKEQILDFKKFSKLKSLHTLKVWGWASYMKFKTINFDQLVKLKKIQNLSWHFDTISFQDFRKTKQIFKNEKYDGDRTTYDYDYDYYVEEDPEYKKNWTRFNHINSDHWMDEFRSLEDRYIEIEKEESRKKTKHKKKVIIRKKK